MKRVDINFNENHQTELPGMLKALRGDSGLTIADLARLSGCSETAIYRWERGQRVPDIQRFERLLSALGADLVIVSKR